MKVWCIHGRWYAAVVVYLLLILVSCNGQPSVQLQYQQDSQVIAYGIEKLTQSLANNGYQVEVNEQKAFTGDFVILNANSEPDRAKIKSLTNNITNPPTQGYHILKIQEKVFIIGGDERGCLYGIMDVIEQLSVNPDLTAISERQINPAMDFRAIKFNLPWSPYRPGPAAEIHMETCRDLKFWEAFLDMMVKNRFNALTLWNKHPFPYLIRAKNYPEATPFTDTELDQWRQFWKSLFKMAKNRGIETYLVNWNIVVSREFSAAYGANEYSDTSNVVKQYTRESVTQLINEYEDLTGLGVTLADWMGNWGDFKMTPVEREQWIEETFVQGIKNAQREARFIHRAVLAGDPAAMRKVIDGADLSSKTVVEVKFNWSHGHSTPKLSITHANDQGSIMEGLWNPKPDNYFIAWMIRNEDFFVLRWGDPAFIRDHINTNLRDFVDGYFIGSEGYIPATDYSHIPDHPHKTWEYAFEKQWMFYHLWGRLMFNPETTDKQLAAEIDIRYPEAEASKLLEAYGLASKMSRYLASFYKGTWDFTLYSEGFLAPRVTAGYDDEKSPFISIEELIKHETLDPDYLSITEYVNRGKDMEAAASLVTPVELAEVIRSDASGALKLIEDLRDPQNMPTLTSELDDLATWCYLGYYFADKLNAGVSLANYMSIRQDKEKQQALHHLNLCVDHWKNIIELTESRYQPMPYVSMEHDPEGSKDPEWPEFTSFHWSNFLKDVLQDVKFVQAME